MVQEINITRAFSNKPSEAYYLNVANVENLTITNDLHVGRSIVTGTLGASVRVAGGSFSSDVAGNVSAPAYVLTPYLAANTVVTSFIQSNLSSSFAAQFDGMNTYLTGNVGIGTLPSQTYKLNVGGVIHATNVVSDSDSRVKANLQIIQNPLEKIKALNGYTFSRTDDLESGRRHVGLIAQEVERVLPEAVFAGNNSDETLALAYGPIVAVCIEGLKALAERIERLELTMQ